VQTCAEHTQAGGQSECCMGVLLRCAHADSAEETEAACSRAAAARDSRKIITRDNEQQKAWRREDRRDMRTRKRKVAHPRTTAVAVAQRLGHACVEKAAVVGAVLLAP